MYYGKKLIYQIDKVLYFFSLTELKLPNGTKIPVTEPYSKFEAKKMITQVFPEFNNDNSFYDNYIGIIDKLEKDGHIKIIPEIIRIPKFPDGTTATGVRTQKEGCKITFEGLLWLERDGYLGESRRNNLAERRVQISQTLTWILAVGVTATFAKDLFEVARVYYNPIMKPLVYFLLPACFGVFALWLLRTILKGIHRNRNK